jgi:hypothetical protein
VPKTEPYDFASEVRRHFQFLVDEYDMAGPEYSELLLPAVYYERPELRIGVFLEHGDGATRLLVNIDLPEADWRASADLPDLVEAAVFAPRHQVPGRVHTSEILHDTLDQNATWLRRLLPLLLGPDGEALLRKANERPVDRAGNPKRRPPGIRWKYP